MSRFIQVFETQGQHSGISAYYAIRVESNAVNAVNEIILSPVKESNV
jgi:hypothetical protein